MGLMDIAMEDLKRHEGFRGMPYRDTLGVLTVGYGRNLDAKGISEPEAHFMLRNDIIDALQNLTMLEFWGSLSETRQVVLVDMAINLGFRGLLNFKKMIAAMRARDYNKAADEMLDSVWALQVGNRAMELAQMMRG